jgi:hypothetical protein
MPDKRDLSFGVPSEVQNASQAGWVYRSDAAPTARPAGAPAAPSEDSVQEVVNTSVPRRRPSSAGLLDEALELLVLPFAIPFLHLLSATGSRSSRRRPSSK